MKVRIIENDRVPELDHKTAGERVIIESTLHHPGYLPRDIKVDVREDAQNRVIVSIQGGKVSMQPRAAGIWLEIEPDK